jgi:hypothetical protein
MSTRIFLLLLVMLIAVTIFGCRNFYFNSDQAMPDLGGVYLTHSASIRADPDSLRAILTAFRETEMATTTQDLDRVLSFYTRHYTHRGFNPSSIRTVWKELFHEYDKLTLTQVLSEISVESDRNPPTAKVVCTGGLWGTSRNTGKRRSIDSWYYEVNYLVLEDGKWRTSGHAWEVLQDKDTRFARPPHPMF